MKTIKLTEEEAYRLRDFLNTGNLMLPSVIRSKTHRNAKVINLLSGKTEFTEKQWTDIASEIYKKILENEKESSDCKKLIIKWM